MSSSLCFSIPALTPHYWRPKNFGFFLLLQSNRCICFAPRFVACLKNDDSVAIPKPAPVFTSSSFVLDFDRLHSFCLLLLVSQLAFDPAEELYGLDVDLKPRLVYSGLILVIWSRFCAELVVVAVYFIFALQFLDLNSERRS